MCTQSLRGALRGTLITAGLLGAASWSGAGESPFSNPVLDPPPGRDAPMEEIIVYGPALHALVAEDRMKADVLARMQDLHERLKRSIRVDAASIPPLFDLARSEVEVAGRNELAADARG